MAYTVTTSSGSTLASIADGTVNNSASSLTLIGKNYAGYGIFLNENYVKLLENFANSTAPSSALAGQLWYDSNGAILKVYTGTQWKPISSSTASATAPTEKVAGDLWWDTSNAQLKVYSGSAWITIGPSFTASAGTSGAVVETILDTATASHVVVKFYISNSVIAILSKDATFTPSVSITGFSTIKPGLNLISSSSLTGSQFTGDASNALALNGIAASAFLRSDQNTSTAYKITAGGGVTVGSDLELTSGTDISLECTTLDKDIKVTVNTGGTALDALVIDGATTTTTANALVVTNSTTLEGAVTCDDTLRLNGTTTVAGTVLPSANNTISIGSSSSLFANVYATTFRGTAITAQYADLAERFEADSAYPAGTVVELGGAKEITSVVEELSEKVFGVISTAAGFLMNGSAGDDVSHPPIAMSGRVPVRVVGFVAKGDRLVSAGNGLARAATRDELTSFNVIGRSLEDKSTEEIGTVEAVVKLNS